MSNPWNLSVVAAVAMIACGAIQAGPAMAEDANSTVIEADGTQSVEAASSVDSLVARVDQLIAAYNPSTQVLDTKQVPNETLQSPEGQAFEKAIALVASGASNSELSDAIVALRGQVSPAQNSLPPAFQVLLTGGADPFPYVQLTNDEQQVMVSGSSGTLVLAICALLGPETAGAGCGVGAAVISLIVGIIVANGVCPNNRQMRIYPLIGPAGFSCQ